MIFLSFKKDNCPTCFAKIDRVFFQIEDHEASTEVEDDVSSVEDDESESSLETEEEPIVPVSDRDRITVAQALGALATYVVVETVGNLAFTKMSSMIGKCLLDSNGTIFCASVQHMKMLACDAKNVVEGIKQICNLSKYLLFR